MTEKRPEAGVLFAERIIYPLAMLCLSMIVAMAGIYAGSPLCLAGPTTFVQKLACHDPSIHWFNGEWLHESWTTELMHENDFLEETAAQHGRGPHDHAMISAIQP
jgi:hypothetical protein